MTARGFFAIGIVNTKTWANVGTLWRSATLFDAAFVFTVGRRYQRQSSDTTGTPRHIPLFHFETIDDLREHLPWSCPLVGVELDPRSTMLADYQHPERAAYLLGAEDHGLSPDDRDLCHDLLQIEAAAPWSMNVSTAGSIVLHDRYVKSLRTVTA